MDMDDIKLFAKNEKELLQITWNGIQLPSHISVGRAGGGTDLAGCGSVTG